MPRNADPNRDGRSPSEGGNPFSRGGPRPWATDPPTVVPQLVLAPPNITTVWYAWFKKGPDPS